MIWEQEEGEGMGRTHPEHGEDEAAEEEGEVSGGVDGGQDVQLVDLV